MKDSILCAIDFSESSMHAIQWAYKLALGSKADLAVLYSYRLLQTGTVNDILLFKRKKEEEARKKFLELESQLGNGKKLPLNFITEIGFFSDNIENYVRKNPYALIVMSNELANSIYEHKNLTLPQFIKNLRSPLLIVPPSFQKNEATVLRKDELKAAS